MVISSGKGSKHFEHLLRARNFLVSYCVWVSQGWEKATLRQLKMKATSGRGMREIISQDAHSSSRFFQVVFTLTILCKTHGISIL
jgi:hypothetical protein